MGKKSAQMIVIRKLAENEISRELFRAAARFACENGAEKLYISSHSAVETQAFYKKMGCKEALEINASHVKSLFSISPHADFAADFADFEVFFRRCT